LDKSNKETVALLGIIAFISFISWIASSQPPSQASLNREKLVQDQKKYGLPSGAVLTCINGWNYVKICGGRGYNTTISPLYDKVTGLLIPCGVINGGENESK